MITKRTRKGLQLVGEFAPPKVVNPSGYVFENARGGPYKYGQPLASTVENLRLLELGLL